MSASLPLVSTNQSGSGELPGLGVNSASNQSDSGLSKTFGPVLGEAVTALEQSGDGASNASPEAEKLFGQLQGLPQGGKLLPLLQLALDQGVANGLDPQQVVDQLAARLESLQPEPGMDSAQRIAEALQQLIGGLAPETVPVAGQSQLALRGLAGSGGQPLSDTLVVNAQAEKSGSESQSVFEKLSMPRLEQHEARELKLSGLEQAITRLQQQAPAPEARQADIATMAVVFKRLAAEFRAGSADAGGRSDISPAGAVPTPGTAAPSAPGIGLPNVTLNTPFGQAGWDQAVGERIQWMVSQKMQGAQVKLNPAHLGPMEVRIQVQNDQASVHFTAHQGVVREALEAALPRLRDMFEAAGVELLDVDVSGQSFAEQQAMREDSQSSGTGSDQSVDGIGSDAEVHMQTPLDRVLEHGVVDLFA